MQRNEICVKIQIVGSIMYVSAAKKRRRVAIFYAMSAAWPQVVARSAVAKTAQGRRAASPPPPSLGGTWMSVKVVVGSTLRRDIFIRKVAIMQ